MVAAHSSDYSRQTVSGANNRDGIRTSLGALSGTNFSHRRSHCATGSSPDIIVPVWARSLVSTETNNQEFIHD